MIAGWVNDASNIAGGGGRVRRDGRTRRAAQVTQLTLTHRLLSVWCLLSRSQDGLKSNVCVRSDETLYVR